MVREDQALTDWLHFFQFHTGQRVTMGMRDRENLLTPWVGSKEREETGV